jgi:putative transposase
MPRRRRYGTAGIAHHVLNRACRRAVLFADADDYLAFLNVLAEAKAKFTMRILGYAVMPNHWHLILWPREDLQLSRFMHWFTMTHTQRWHTRHGTTGTGPLYQGRYKAIPVQSDQHLLTVMRYVERNPVRAGLVDDVTCWQWSSAWERYHGRALPLLDGSPVPLPENWMTLINEGQNQIHLSGVREAVRMGTPFGDSGWTRLAATAFDLRRTFRPQGRPGKK